MNTPSRVIGLCLVVAGLAWIGLRKEPAYSMPSSEPSHQARVIAFTCDPNLGRPRADLSIQNTGQTTIEFPQATVQFGSGANSGHLRPYPLRPGGTASATIFAPTKDDSGCTLLSVQDRDGYSVSLK